ncbi:MAG: dephospho-CoA kinase [Ruminococcus sp.]|nr:dephospho-CoA kinase [Ruminococcus sp.]
MVIGLTGQTGAGKSTVSRVFAENGYAIINADHISRKVVEKGSECLKEITEIFGLNILNPDETLNRKELAKIVFVDKTKLEMLNSIIYPYITTEIISQIKHFSENGKKLILLDAPTLFESHSDDFCEIIISVVAEPETRKKRIIQRDNITAEQAQNRMNLQLSTEFFIEHSDFIIENNDSVDVLNGISKEVADKIKYYYYDIRSVAMTEF